MCEAEEAHEVTQSREGDQLFNQEGEGPYMIEWIQAESSGHFFFYAFPVALLLLFVLMRGYRVRFVIPSVIITVMVVNPWFYEHWDALDLYAYWRILWIAPIIPIVAAVFPVLSERAGEIKINKPRIGSIVLPVIAGVGILGIVLGGNFVYNTSRGLFAMEIINSSKLPEQAVEIADRLLKLEEHPKIIAQYPLGVYIRQYAGEIDQLYGRDIDGYILRANNDARNISSQLSDPEGDLNAVATFMANDDYEYLVIADEGREEQLIEARFELIDHVFGYGIYRAYGTATVIKQKNEYGQVISQTTIDENGMPVNGESGYATISYVYDNSGNIIREFRTDVDGTGVVNDNGAAGFIREYDSYAHVVMEKTIGPDEAAVANNAGYAEVRREYNGSKLKKESYYDAEGQPVCVNGYASVERKYDADNNIILQRFLDMDDHLVVTGLGYAEIHRVFENNLLIREAYFGSDGMPYANNTGYAEVRRE